MVWYSHLFKNFPQFVLIHTVTGFGVVNKEEVDVFLEFSCFFYDPVVVDNLILCLSETQLLYLKVFSSRTVEAWLGEF